MKRFIKLIVSIFLAVLLVSCGSSNKAEYGNNIQTENIGQGSTTDNSKNNVVYETNRKIVYTVSYNVSGDSVKETNKAINNKVIEMTGYISSSDESETRSYYVYRIPTNSLNTFLDFVDQQGGVSHKKISTEDITSTYNYTQARIDTLTASKAAYVKLLEDDTLSRSEIILIQDKINEIDTELTRLNMDKAVYDNEVDYATVSITYYNNGYSYAAPTYFEEYADYLLEFVKGVGSFILYSLPVFLLLFAIFASIFFPVRKKIVKRRQITK